MMDPFQSLFQNVMKSKWEEVIQSYEGDEGLHTAKITSSCDTALHIAISNGEVSVVERLVAIVYQTKGALSSQNELGNTPLHLAAYLGDAKMCHCIASRDTRLMGIRNHDKETPFFLAVRHGRKGAFYAMHSICVGDEGYTYSRGREGETILHSAIYGEYFDLAFDIITHYDKLVNAVNENGVSPLHILANKPSAFRSGSQIRGIDKLIYHCIFVDELEHKMMHNEAVNLQYREDSNYPENYHTCLITYNLLWGILRVLLGHSRQKFAHDEENIKHHKQVVQIHQEEEEEIPKGFLRYVLCGRRSANAERHQFEGYNKQEETTKRKAQGHEFLPKNYINCFNFVKLISKAMLVILGLGSKSVDKIKEKKTKHIWSMQIMEKLLDAASSYQYEYNGKRPSVLPHGKSTQIIPPTHPEVEGDIDPTKLDYDADNDGGGGAGAGAGAEEEAAAENPKATKGEERLECGKCKEMVCSVLGSLGLLKNNAALKALCSKGKGSTALDMEKKETPILIAARSGVVEMVEGILERFPVAIHDMNVEKKNVVLLSVEHRQPHVYKYLLDRKMMKDTIFRKTDKNENSALHLAARFGEYKPWLIPGDALQMQWEIKWYEFVKNSMPLHFFPRYNKESKTPKEIFNETHEELAKQGGAWLISTSQSCSVVAALIATVAFATSATVPGGVKGDNSGTPTLQNQPAFSVFAISSLVALCFSVTSVIMFLAILTSRFQEKDFGADLPRKLLIGLTSLFISIGSMLISFCAGHFFVLKNKLKYAAFPLYAITCLPVTFFAINQFPLYFDLIWATIRKIPQRSSK
ncbi:uncharacterized protein LOC125187915 [Salvia hispanica]|uniref:uncharacterized protein LOC125187915 n=1 Tax=Salvia hispanica TaxID=49212 RepID=UPI0020094DC7|nr:uncharacterized protein LOC125187915 [Salvia hispanica]